MRVRKGQESLSFEEGIKNEERRGNVNDGEYNELNFSKYSYVSRGKYFEQIKKWREYFPREQFLVIKTEDFEKNEQETLNTVYKFLDLAPYTNKKLERKNVGNYSQKIDEKVRTKLNNYFKPHNEELIKFLNIDFDWK